MNDSIELLSSMSPRIKVKLKTGENQFRRVRGASILALKRNIRRSSIYDKYMATESNVNVVENDSTESCESAEYNSPDHNDPEFPSVKDGNENKDDSIIVISDSASDSSSIDLVQKSKEQTYTKSDNLLPKHKLDAISNWVKKVNIENETSSSVYTELSTIYGSGNYFIASNNGHATNSTFYKGCNKKFDEMFVKTNKLKVYETKSTNTDDLVDQSMKNLTMEDSFEIINQSLQSRIQKDDSVKNVKEVKTMDKKDSLIENNKKGSQKVQDNSIVEDTDALKLLDKLYGNSWRANRELILSKTEPRKNIRPPSIKNVTSERKPKTSLLYKNPYVESEKSKSQILRNNIYKTKRVDNSKSPWMERLKVLCDSDTNSENSPPKITATKLKFDESSDDETTSNYFKTKSNSSNKENKNNNNRYSDKAQYVTKKNLFTKNTDGNDSKNSENNWTSDSSSVGASTYNTKKTDLDLLVKPKIINMKTPKKVAPIARKMSSSSNDEEWDAEVSKIERKVEEKFGTYSFLASLSENIPITKCDMSARVFRNNFKKYKDQLVKKLFVLYNDKVFDNILPEDMSIEWNDRMRSSSGFCYCKKITRRNGDVERSARIVLSSKVIDRADRVRDTLIHEMCHAVTWIKNCVSDGHGDYWKSWAFKAMKTFPELPIITRCHNYVISTKYTYRCTVCGYSFGRHSKSLDIERKRCGYCCGKFEVLINKTNKKGETKAVVATPKKEATGFALFVKENYGSYKVPERKHADVMKILGQKFQAMKVERK